MLTLYFLQCQCQIAEVLNHELILVLLPQHTRKEFNSFFCYLIVVTAVSLATFVAFLIVFLLETALQEGIPLH